MTVCQIFFKFKKFIQNFRTQNVFGKFLLIVLFRFLTSNQVKAYYYPKTFKVPGPDKSIKAQT